MAVGMVAEQPLAEPQQPLDAERLVQPHGDILAGQRRVSVRVEQAFLGGDSESGAVDIDAAALEHPILLVDRQAARRAERRADFQIARHDELFAPPVEAEIPRAPYGARAGADRPRSDARSVGKRDVSRVRSRWSQFQKKKKKKNK